MWDTFLRRSKGYLRNFLFGVVRNVFIAVVLVSIVPIE